MRTFPLLTSALACGWLTLVTAAAQKPLPAMAEKPPTATPAKPTPPPAPTPTKPASTPTPAPAPSFVAALSLVRYDLPVGNSDGYAPTRQLARWRDDQDAVHWPDLTLDGKPIFRGRTEERIPLRLRTGGEAASFFQNRTDDVIQPGNHWFRPMEWRGGRRHIYTADRDARVGGSTDTQTARYELWAFPVQITGDGGPAVRNVILKAGNKVIYKKDGPWRTLTLLLPASEAGRPYELAVDGRPPVKLEVGLMPSKVGSPRERVFAMDAFLGGDGPKLRVVTGGRSEIFPNPKEWAVDLAALKQPPAAGAKFERPAGLHRHLGVDAPYSPFTVYAVQLPHNMSGGFFRQGVSGFTGSAEEYAAHLAAMGFDAVFDQANVLPAAADPAGFEARAAALARHGVKLGFQFDNNWSLPSFQNPALAILSHTLPEWHAPLYRNLSLAAQRYGRLPNFLGFTIGGNSVGYAADWYPAPPTPDRPWGQAMIELMGKPQPTIPRPPGAGPPQLPIEYVAKDMGEFIKYVGRYDAAFQQYGYFAEAVREGSGRLILTTGSFGSSPGPGARGGWPWASLPGRSIFGGLNVQQAYDLNQTHAGKPMHNEALVDRLASYWQNKTTWSLVDNFQFVYGREAFQRACALALTRGIQGLGTNFLAKPTGAGARPDVVDFQTEMFSWIRRYGGVYAKSSPDAVIGIFYGHHQAVQRGVLTEETPADDKLYEGSAEGKVTEALFLCHAAGWPARVITFQELLRGPLPPSMRAILFVGDKPADATWSWSAGLEKPLQLFLGHGGRILVDDESSSPVPSTSSGLRVAAYQPQSNFDFTPLLLQRNASNIEKLRSAMEGVPQPVAVSHDPTVWALPTECGDLHYVTVVNEGSADGDDANEMLRPADARATKPERWKTKGNASLYVKPQRGELVWNTLRPIYDVRLGRKVSFEEAAQVDLTKDAFQWYALPPREVVEPKVTVSKGISGFYEAMVEIANPKPMSGIPVKLTVVRDTESVEVFGISGFAVRLPLYEHEAPGEYKITAVEMLSGLSGETAVSIAAATPNPESIQGIVKMRDPRAIARFASRQGPLTIALTPEQENDARLVEQAHALEAFYKSRKRTVAFATVKPGGVVESLQPLRSPSRYPQWKTIPSDLILFGAPSNNVLLFDQLRAEIFPWNYRGPASRAVDIIYTRSPFVGEFDVLNIMSMDSAPIAEAVRSIIAESSNAKK